MLTRSDWSHVDVVIPSGQHGVYASWEYGLLGASETGVRIRPPNYQQFLRRNRMTLETPRADAIIARLLTQLGKPFDYTALYRVFDPNWSNWSNNDKWYCAELVAWALSEEGYWSDRRKHDVLVDLNHIAPLDLILMLKGDFDPVEFATEFKS